MIYVSDKARDKVIQLKRDAELGDDYFLRVGVIGGGCSGLSYKLDFDNEPQPKDQVFEDQGIKVVTDLKSFLYLCLSMKIFMCWPAVLYLLILPNFY